MAGTRQVWERVTEWVTEWVRERVRDRTNDRHCIRRNKDQRLQPKFIEISFPSYYECYKQVKYTYSHACNYVENCKTDHQMFGLHFLFLLI